MSDEEQVPPGFISEDEEIIADFIIEAQEFLEQLDQDLVALEQTPENLELLDNIFRAVHTIKGNSSFLGFDKLTRFTHQLESVLDKLRSGQMAVTADMMDLILSGTDKIRELIENLSDESLVDVEPVLEKLHHVLLASESPAAPAEADDDDEMAEIIEDFIVESGEFLEQLDQDLVSLEQSPEDLELLNDIFRPVHTIKGNASFLGFDKLTRFTHQLENVLDKLRSGDMAVSAAVMDLVLDSVDRIKLLLSHLHHEDAVDVEDLLQRLHHCLDPKAATAQAVATETAPSASTPAPPSTPPAATEATSAAVPEPISPTPQAPTVKKPAPRRKEAEEQTIRVDIERLDALMNLAGELVIAKNRLQQFSQQFDALHRDSELAESLMLTQSLIGYITGQFQEAVMKARMLPIRKVFSKIPRLIRDLARDTKKQVELVLEGEDTELDKSVIEHIGDPLVHIIRNAVDHGLEYPHERESTGKPPQGNVLLRAYSEGNYIIIEIKDDGRGMDPQKIFNKAVEKGLSGADKSGILSPAEMLDFIFAPGFSTAESVSNISGRGVGMNVVKENIMKLDGLIEIDSVVGHGTTFRIQLPLTMAIVPALLVQVDKATYAIPLNNVVETLVISTEQIYHLDQREMIHLRDRVVSLVHLSEVLGQRARQPAAIRENADADGGDKYYVIIVGAGEQRVGLVVDHLQGQEEVVIKTLGEFFEEIHHIAGATIMGDGSVVLILNIGNILQHINRKPNFTVQG